MLRHEAGDEVIHFALPACDRHGLIVGEYKANVKGNQLRAITHERLVTTARVERTLLSVAFDFDFDCGFDMREDSHL
jgi:hypothetical protein